MGDNERYDQDIGFFQYGQVVVGLVARSGYQC
jgi:hypothetical protein